MLAGAANNSVKKAIQLLARRALLLQEAKIIGRGTLMPKDPATRAEFFLRRVASESAICGNISPRDLKQMYRVMKPRFVRGDLYHVAQLQWLCPARGHPENADCIRRSWQFAHEHWEGIIEAVKAPADLYWLAQFSTNADSLRYVEMTVHVTKSGGSNVPPHVASAVQSLISGQANLALDQQGARIQLLMEHRPALNRTLENRSVRAEVRAELCPRLVTRQRQQYVADLLKTAQIEVFKKHFPPNSDWDEKP